MNHVMSTLRGVSISTIVVSSALAATALGGRIASAETLSQVDPSALASALSADYTPPPALFTSRSTPRLRIEVVRQAAQDRATVAPLPSVATNPQAPVILEGNAVPQGTPLEPAPASSTPTGTPEDWSPCPSKRLISRRRRRLPPSSTG